MSHPPIQIVDDKDQPVGSATVFEAQDQGLYHRIARVMIEDPRRRVLLQKRQATKLTYPDCWDNSASGHVDFGETYEQAAARELYEEMGIKGFPLMETKYYQTEHVFNGLVLRRFNKLYTTTVPAETPIMIQDEEVSEAAWFTIAEVNNLITNYPDKVSDGLIEAFRQLYQE